MKLFCKNSASLLIVIFVKTLHRRFLTGPRYAYGSPCYMQLNFMNLRLLLLNQIRFARIFHCFRSNIFLRQSWTLYLCSLTSIFFLIIIGRLEGGDQLYFHILFRNLPYFQSKNCSLAKLSPKQLVEHHEESEEWGGYFIINGIEKILRMLIMPRRNYVSNMLVGKFADVTQ